MAKARGVSRRRFLEIAGLAGGAALLRSYWGAGDATASEDDPQILLVCYFNGGWDQLLAFDPRPNTLYKFTKAQAYGVNGTGIYPAYQEVDDPYVANYVFENPSGIKAAGDLTFGPAVPDSLVALYDDIALLRGVQMDTLTHEVGRRYFLTGRFPSGLSAVGSSLGSVVAAAEGGGAILPNLAIGTEAYIDDLPAYATPMSINGADDILSVLKPLGKTLDPAGAEALAQYEAEADTCEQHAFDGSGLVSLFKSSREKVKAMLASTASALFAFDLKAPPPEVKPLFDALGIQTQADLNGAKGRAAIAAQALAHGISQAVSIQMTTQPQLDTHADWGDFHATNLRVGLETIANLIKHLKNTPFKGGQDSVWSHTTMLVFSDFARTPLLNGRNGRDHHLVSSCMVAGPGIKGNSVCGATSDAHMGARMVDPKTGMPDDFYGVKLRPVDIHATLLHSMGLSYDHLKSQSPVLLEAILK